MLLTAVQNGFDKCLLQKYQLVNQNQKQREMALLARLRETRGLGWLKDGNGSGLGRISMGFGFGFSPVDIQWISEINHLELKLMFCNILIIICLLRLLNLFKVDS